MSRLIVCVVVQYTFRDQDPGWQPSFSFISYTTVVGSCATQSCAYLSRVHDSMTLGQPGFVICEHATMQDYLAWNVEKISDMFGKKRVTGPSLNQHSYIYIFA